MTRATKGILLRAALGAALLLAVLQFVDVGDAWRAMRSLDPSWFAASAGCHVATRLLMGAKWWSLLGGPKASVGYPTVQRALCLSDFYGLLFPNTLAVDATRVMLLRHHPSGAAFMTAAILADRVTNVAATALTSLVALGLLALASGGLPFPGVVVAGVLAVCVGVLAICACVTSQRLFMLVSRRLLEPLRAWPRVARHRGVFDAFERTHSAMSTMLSSRQTLVPAIAFAFSVVFVRVLSIHVLFLAVGAPQPLLLTLALVPVISVIALLPISLFGFGLKEGAFLFFFGGAGVATSLALAVSVTKYGVLIVGSIVLGVLATVLGPALPAPRGRPVEVPAREAP